MKTCMKNRLIYYFVLVLIGFGCQKENSNNEQTPLLKTKWILSYIQDTKTNAVINYPNDAVKEISLVFTDSSNVVFFQGVCNSGQGKYSYSSINDSIKIKDLGTTKIYCKNIEWEVFTTSNMYDAFKLKVNGSNLVIYSKGAYNLYFKH